MKFVSLFSGCGGLDLGLTQAGFQLALGADNDPRCAESHATNFPGSRFFAGSIADLDEAQLRAALGTDFKRMALLAGGPPCPPYSKSRFYRTEMPRALADPVGNVTMEGYLRVLRLLQPEAFLLENVPGMAYGVHRAALDHLLLTATAAGYECTWQVLNAADYGVPQIRERFFLVGTRRGSFTFPAPTHAQRPEKDLFGYTLRPWRTAGEVLEDLDTDENASDVGHFAGGKHHALLREIPPGDNYLYFTPERGHATPLFKWRSRYWSFLLKLSPQLPSWTIQARRSNNMGPFHWRNRILRISEIKRLQTFPDEWALSGTIEQQWRQVGNAVPPLLAATLGRQIAVCLQSQVARPHGSRTRIVPCAS
jgi:DNA (cytosine-5)-methyltransferase 1